jgi:sporulation protein YlmC with PRC-barrel domain
MLIAAKQMYGMPLEGSDGRVGSLYDLLFDDQSWKLRHLVVSVDRWFLGRQVLLDPEAVERIEWPQRRLRVRLTKDGVRHSPSVETDLPVARRESMAAAQVLVWEAYWTSILDTSPGIEGDAHLRSTKMLAGLHLHCTDGPLGHVEDFLIDDQPWSVRDLVVDTRNWWPGKRVRIEPALVESIDWDDREIRLSLPREQVEDRPAYEYAAPSNEPMVGAV